MTKLSINISIHEIIVDGDGGGAGSFSFSDLATDRLLD